MTKKYSIVFKVLRLIIFILLSSFALVSYAEKGHLSLKILSIDSSYSTPDEVDINNGINDTDSFLGAISIVHPPVLVDYDGQKSLLLFVPANVNDLNKNSLIYNFNLSNHKMNEVGRLSDGEILSIFGDIFPKDGAYIFILQKTKLHNDEILYSTRRFSILKEDGGLYIQSFKLDRVSIPDLSNCIDGGSDRLGGLQVCKYKDAASIKKFFDDRGND